jgi:hypothetical protein
MLAFGPSRLGIVAQVERRGEVGVIFLILAPSSNVTSTAIP